MTKRIASFILVLILALGLLPFGALADETGGAEIIASGDCSSQLNPDSVSWKLDSNGLLTISGKGYMNHYGLSYSEAALTSKALSLSPAYWMSAPGHFTIATSSRASLCPKVSMA